MLEVVGDLWAYPADVRCITTNGYITKAGKCVMGKGCAKEAKDKFPGIDKELGLLIHLHGNVVHKLRDDLYSFPVKHKWYEKADIELIKRSAQTIFHIMPVDARVVLPRPGCGNGGLRWEDVKPVLEPILDDRFHVITFA